MDPFLSVLLQTTPDMTITKEEALRILELDGTSPSAEDIQMHYQKLALMYHPTKQGTDLQSILIFERLCRSYLILTEGRESMTKLLSQDEMLDVFVKAFELEGLRKELAAEDASTQWDEKPSSSKSIHCARARAATPTGATTSTDATASVGTTACNGTTSAAARSFTKEKPVIPEKGKQNVEAIAPVSIEEKLQEKKKKKIKAFKKSRKGGPLGAFVEELVREGIIYISEELTAEDASTECDEKPSTSISIQTSSSESTASTASVETTTSNGATTSVGTSIRGDCAACARAATLMGAITSTDATTSMGATASTRSASPGTTACNGTTSAAATSSTKEKPVIPEKAKQDVEAIAPVSIEEKSQEKKKKKKKKASKKSRKPTNMTETEEEETLKAITGGPLGAFVEELVREGIIYISEELTAEDASTECDEKPSTSISIQTSSSESTASTASVETTTSNGATTSVGTSIRGDCAACARAATLMGAITSTDATTSMGATASTRSASPGTTTCNGTTSAAATSSTKEKPVIPEKAKQDVEAIAPVSIEEKSQEKKKKKKKKASKKSRKPTNMTETEEEETLKAITGGPLGAFVEELVREGILYISKELADEDASTQWDEKPSKSIHCARARAATPTGATISTDATASAGTTACNGTTSAAARSFTKEKPVIPEKGKQNVEAIAPVSIEEKSQEKKKKKKKASKKSRKCRQQQEKQQLSKAPKSESSSSSEDEKKETEEDEDELDPNSAFVATALRRKTNGAVPKPSVTSLGAIPKTPKMSTVHLIIRSQRLAWEGYELCIQERHKEAVELFTQAIKLYAEDDSYFGNRSYCYSILEKYDKALMDAEKAISLQPQGATGYFLRAKAQLGLQKYSEAAESLKKVLEIDPTCLEAQTELRNVHIFELMSMGFPQKQAEWALTLGDEDFQRAIVILCGPDAVVPDVKMNPCNMDGYRSLWVGNIQPEVTEKMLIDLFRRYGDVHSIRILRDRYCAFINYGNKLSPGRAMEALQGHVLCGKAITIRFPDNNYLENGSKKGPVTVLRKSSLMTSTVEHKAASTSSGPKAKVSGPVNGNECYFWRTTGCIFGDDCYYEHIPCNKGIDWKMQRTK